MTEPTTRTVPDVPPTSNRGERPVTDISYVDAMAELDGIVKALDEGSLDVDDLADRFQRAVDIVEELDRRITANRVKIEQLAPRLRRLAGRDADRTDASVPSASDAFDDEPF
ncbi:MAG: exodeoxyribonuclease VII small subunit [Actinomycetota bacterium]|nr:exodeoxyribonuclease VII small subunit [Actinomycetota bacterium]